MTKKNSYPGGVKLTATKARAVAMQEFGTAKGLTKEETAMPGYFKMRLGNLFIRIHPAQYCRWNSSSHGPSRTGRLRRNAASVSGVLAISSKLVANLHTSL